MTTILGRYVFRQAFGALVLILASLTCVIWIAVALRQLEFMANQGTGGLLFLKMTTLALPGLLAFIAPVAMLIAVVHTLNRLNGDSELIIATSGGASTWRLLWPLMSLGILVAIAVFLVANWAAPAANRTLRDLALEARTDLISTVLQPGRFNAVEPKLVVHIRDKGADGTLLGLLMHDTRDEKQVASYLAESGYIVKQAKSAYLLMRNGHVLRTSQSVDGATDIVAFESYAIDIARFEQKTDGNFVLRPRERLSTELWAPDPEDPVWKHSPGRLTSELHDRLAAPLYAIANIFIALAFVGQAQTTRQNRTRGVVTAIAAGFGCRITGIAFANLAVSNPKAVPLLYAAPIAASLIAAAIVFANMRPRPQSRLSRQITEFNARLAQSLTSLVRRRPKAATPS